VDVEHTIYTGRILRVDLSTGKMSKELFDPGLLRKYVGSTGLGTKILYDEVPPGVEPFDPANRMIFASGPLGGTSAPGSGNYGIVTKGPLTNLLSSAEANGFWGPRLRFAGFDAIVIQGVSPEWVYLWVHDGEAELRPAQHLLGVDTRNTEDRIKQEVGQDRASVACIGPAGENLVKFAAVCSDMGHIASTNGPGAVMGSKKLKAIAVFGEDRVKVYDADRLKSIRSSWVEIAERSRHGAMWKEVGTLCGYAPLAMMGVLPVKNLTESFFPEYEKFSAEYIRTQFEFRKRPCWSCSWSHCGTTKVTEGPYTGFEAEEPEYEPMAAWSSLVGVTDPGTTVKINDVNDRLGMDAKEAGFLTAMVMECYEKGVIGPQETDGLELRWGNAEAIIQLLDNIAHRRGFGDVLAEGTKRASDRIGGDAPNFAVYTKQGISPHIHDPRQIWSFMVGQSFSDMGSIQGSAPEFMPDPDLGYEEPIAPFSAKELPAGMAKGVAWARFMDTLGMCVFWGVAGNLSIVADALSAATGWDFTPQEALEVGERVTTLQRSFNIRHGATPEKDDVISPRLAQAPMGGPAEGKTIVPVYSQIRRDYYKAMGWDEVTSKPLHDTLKRLGLENVVKDLWG
jgi:aldehyde:ferredoxin oxidoreductase